MKKFSCFMTKYKKTIIALFVLLAIAGGLSTTIVTVKYLMVDYLPQIAQSINTISAR